MITFKYVRFYTTFSWMQRNTTARPCPDLRSGCANALRPSLIRSLQQLIRKLFDLCIIVTNIIIITVYSAHATLRSTVLLCGTVCQLTFAPRPFLCRLLPKDWRHICLNCCKRNRGEFILRYKKMMHNHHYYNTLHCEIVNFKLIALQSWPTALIKLHLVGFLSV